MSDNMSWGEYSYECYVASRDGLDITGHPLPAWSELTDEIQLDFEEHARQITAHVGKKFFGDNEELASKAFDMGKGNLDIADEMLGS